MARHYYAQEDTPTEAQEREELTRELARQEAALQQFQPSQALELVRLELKRQHNAALGRGNEAEAKRIAHIWTVTQSHLESFVKAAVQVVALARELRGQRDALAGQLDAIQAAAADDWNAHPITRAVARGARHQATADGWDTFMSEFARGLAYSTGLDEEAALSVLDFLSSKSLDDSGLQAMIEALQAAQQVWEAEGQGQS